MKKKSQDRIELKNKKAVQILQQKKKKDMQDKIFNIHMLSNSHLWIFPMKVNPEKL